MKIEVTQGMYEEFVRDIQERPERVPDLWVKEQAGAASPRDVNLWRHIPEGWIVRDKDGEPVSWHLDPLARNLPVTHVSYYDAWGFAEWASRRLGMKLAVPTEMEWTRAARAGRLAVPARDPSDGSPREPWRWPWGAEPLIYACNNAQFWPGKGRPEYVHLVYSEPRGGGGGATPDGLMAMAGNVAEWAVEEDVELVPRPVFDAPAYIANKPRADVTSTAWAMGGSFRDGIDDCQVDSKRSYPKNDDRLSRRDDLGFRLVRRQ
jgi:formylglycine-generating enzyme required for sulfatase activity